jgi:hypothetical protein
VTTNGEAALGAASFPPRILNLCSGADTGGQGWRLRRAFTRHSDWAYRLVTGTVNYLDWPTDARWDPQLVAALWQQADVVHLRNWVRPIYGLQRRWPKALVLNHHGTGFRDHSSELDAQAQGLNAVQVVATVDLLQLAGNLVWLPSPFDLDELAAIRKRIYRKGNVIRIAHAPTNRGIKGTAEIMATVERLRERHPIELDIIENVPNAECLARKARADILVDQLILGYGNNAIESWAMGTPVIAGVTDPWTRAKMLELWGALPFVDATEVGLEARLEELITDRSARVAAAKRGLAHVQRFHAEERVVEMAKAVYARALAAVGKPVGRPATTGAMSRGKPFRPPGLVRVEVKPGDWRFLRPKVAARYGVVETEDVA